MTFENPDFLLETKSILISLKEKLSRDSLACIQTIVTLNKVAPFTGINDFSAFLKAQEDFRVRISLIDQILQELDANPTQEVLTELLPKFEALKSSSFLFETNPQLLN